LEQYNPLSVVQPVTSSVDKLQPVDTRDINPVHDPTPVIDDKLV
jgi:hypothetical protein